MHITISIFLLEALLCHYTTPEMDSPLAALKFIFPQLPGISWAAAQHTLGLSQTSSKWDLRTELTVHVLRQILNPKSGRKVPPLGKLQAGTVKEPGVKGKTWIATATIAKPPADDEREGRGLRDAVFTSIDQMKTGEVLYTKPELADIEVEWTGFRPNAGKDEPLPKVSEEEKYRLLMAEPCRTSDITILYFHGVFHLPNAHLQVLTTNSGGAYYLCDPRTHRTLASRLAKETNGRTCSVRYRLAPQSAFPSQLIDAFMVYLSLLYPPPGSMHEAIPAEKIIFGGDSAGGNLSFVLLQLLLQLHRSSNSIPVIRFHGRDVQIPLPAGVSANSGWFDITRAMPSITGNTKYDYLPPADQDNGMGIGTFPKDSIWPADPPRGDIFCDLSLLDHPLVSVLGAESWKTSCPLWLCTGEEMLGDEEILVATRAAGQGVKVHFEQYEGESCDLVSLVLRIY